MFLFRNLSSAGENKVYAEAFRVNNDGKTTLEALSDGALAEGIAPKPRSGRQELIENLFGRYL